MKPKILQIGPITERMTARLEGNFDLISLPTDHTRQHVLDHHAGSVVAALNVGHRGVSSDLMDDLPALKVISNYGVGYEMIDAKEAANRGIVVTHTPSVLNDEVANTAILLWFAVSRKLLSNDAYVRSGRWEREGPAPLSHSVQGRTVGIVGLGRIGQAIADRLAVFDARVLYHTRNARDVPYSFYADLIAMAEASDVMIVITPGGTETRHLIGAQVLEALGPNGILVNVARGSVVDEAALVSALQNGTLGGAGLDVFENEPRVPEELLKMENVVLQPHVGSATHETRQAMGDLACDNLLQWHKNGTTISPVPECAHL